MTFTETTTPTGQPGLQVTCGCKVHGDSKPIIMRRGDRRPTQTVVHNMTGIAYSPLAMAQSVREFGPWRA
jgi:hypothetical protein